MKTIMAIFSLFLIHSLSADASFLPLKIDPELEGVYDYTAKEAPYEYQKGTFEIKKDKNEDNQDQWSIDVIISGYTMTARNVKVDQSKIQFTIYVEGTPVTVRLESKENQLTGTADSYEGPVSIIAKRKINTEDKK